MAHSQKFASASLRYKNRPPRGGMPFRDDQSLIAFRYEQTIQAEPPIPIIPVPPRNPARASRPASTITSASLSIASASLSIASGGNSPIIVAPPPISPNEQHPAFRIRGRTPSAAEDWKRDSGLAATSSSITIREEECEDADHAATYQKTELVGMETASASSGDAKSFTTANSRGDADTVASAVGRCRTQSAEITPPALVLETPQRGVPASLDPGTPVSPLSAAPSSPPPSWGPSSPSSPTSPSAPAPAALPMAPPASSQSPSRETNKRVMRAFSLRPGPQAKKLKKRAAGKEEEVVAAPPPATPPKSPPPVPPKDESEPWPTVRALPKPPKFPKWHLPGFAFGGGSKPDPCPSQLDSDEGGFLPIDTSIPTSRLLEDDFLTSLTFSKRGSMMFGTKRAIGNCDSATGDCNSPMDATPSSTAAGAPLVGQGQAAANSPPQAPITAASTTDAASPEDQPPPAVSATTPPSSGADAAADSSKPASQSEPPKTMQVPNIRILPVDVERESQKVRSLYESGAEVDWRDGRPGSSHSDRLAPTAEVPSVEEENVASPSFSSDRLSPRQHHATDSPRSPSSSSPRRDSPVKREFELAGGIEDWEDVDGADVDRYGFISPRRSQSRDGTPDDTADSPEREALPKKRNVLVKRTLDPAAAYGASAASLSPSRAPSRKVSARSLNTQTSELSTASRRSARSSIRAATNLLPHNRDRRLADEAGDMLSLSPGLSDIAEDEQVERLSDTFKRKEWERAEKWRKMAKLTNKGSQSGGGMEFEFDVRHPKVIDRTWKGIPDRWRAAAWFSFLAASARRHGSGPAEEPEALATEFRRLQDVASPDDTQIDLDVPRTINRHIMFRKRYRGGQRLLFRVLHALSLHFPDTGYVQGMASLAATLLCYYDEERSFVMLVRLWRYRGLERLYQPGFACLMAALGQFERDWLHGKEVAQKMRDLCIDPTAYATRWYLTLFNLSIPFAAQLRVWDVFMLLDEPSAQTPLSSPRLSSVSPSSSVAAAPASPASATAALSTTDATLEDAPPDFAVLHATSTALIHALTEILLDSDFENAMKALTSWVPIKDEELLMKVTRAEWKHHQTRKRA